MITKKTKANLSKYDIENSQKTFSPKNEFMENLFKLITYYGWEWDKYYKEPNLISGLVYGELKETKGKYYSLSQILTLKNQDLKLFKQCVKLALLDIDFTTKEVAPKYFFKSKDVRKLSKEHFSTTVNFLSKSKFNDRNPSEDSIELLFNIMTSELIDLDNKYNVDDMEQAGYLIECHSSYERTKGGNYPIVISTVFKFPWESNGKDKIDIQKYFNSYVSKEEVDDFLEVLESDIVQFYRHGCLVHIDKGKAPRRKKRSLEQDETTLETVHFKGTTAYIFPIL